MAKIDEVKKGVDELRERLLIREPEDFSKRDFVDAFFGAILLGLHLSHGFWSAFHTLGLSNKQWMSRLQIVGKVYAVIIAVGFSVIPLYFLIKF